MLNGPTFSIGLQFVDEHWQITIRELDLCAVAIHAKTFDEAAIVAHDLLNSALLPVHSHKHTTRKRAVSAA